VPMEVDAFAFQVPSQSSGLGCLGIIGVVLLVIFLFWFFGGQGAGASTDDACAAASRPVYGQACATPESQGYWWPGRQAAVDRQPQPRAASPRRRTRLSEMTMPAQEEDSAPTDLQTNLEDLHSTPAAGAPGSLFGKVAWGL